MKAGLLLDPLFKRHDTGPGHPEQPARYDAVTSALIDSGCRDRMECIAPRAASIGELTLCHPQVYVEIVQADVAAGRNVLRTGDTNICAASWDVAIHAVGGILNAVDAVMTGKMKHAFCAVRPPGHHARPVQGMGFCLFNNIAIAARHAQRQHGAAKVAIVDWDVHHGNGTQDTFYEDPSVFFFSTHQSPWYPYTGSYDETGAGKGRGATMNRPFAAGAGMKQIGAAFTDDLLPALDAFKPDLILISAGFDSREGDPLGQFVLQDEDFAQLTRIVAEIANRHSQGRVVSVLEGGYRLSGLASAVAAHVGALIEDPKEPGS